MYCLHTISSAPARFGSRTLPLRVLILVASTLLCLLLAACASKTPYEVLEESVTSELEAFKKADNPIIDQFVEYMDITELEQFGIVPQDFARAFLSDFDFSIDSIEVGEDSAVAYVTIVSKDHARFEEMLQTRIDEMESRYSKRNISSDDYKKMYGDLVMNCIDDVDSISRTQIRIDYLKEGNAWKPTSEVFYTVVNALVALNGE